MTRLGTAVRVPVWLLAGAVLLTVALTVRSTTDAVRWWPALAAGTGVLVFAAARGGPAVLAGAAGATWQVGELAAWAPGHPRLAAAADAWALLLPGMLAAGVLGSRQRAVRVAVAAALAGSVLAAVSRLLLVDPFLDARCRRFCDHNPLLLGPAGVGRWAAAAGVALTLAGVMAAVAPRPPRTFSAGAATALAVSVAVPGVLRLVVPDDATHPAYLVCFVLAQSAAIVLGALVVRDLLARWELSRRLVQLAAALPAAPVPGALAESLRAATGDPGLLVRYWAPGRDSYVDAAGRPAPEPDGRTTLVTRRGRPVAALTPSPGVDGDRVHRALGAALRLALENEQLRAATLAELDELRRSRARLVTRSQLERRRLERNLHDGAQQRMVSLALMVRMLPRGALSERAEALTRSAVAELRRVARGIYPAVLADSGLAGALLDLAESSVDLPIVLDGLPATRYTGPMETTAYLVAEAAVSDARRRGATRFDVRAGDGVGRLCLDLHHDRPPGEAVTPLADQVRALGGDLTVRSEPGGTWIRVELPCGS